MNTAVLAPPASAQRTPSKRRRQLEQPYPLFGFRRRVYQVPSFDRHAAIQEWLLRQDRRQPGEPWPSRWQRCQQEQPNWFKQLWEVYLPRPSRALKQGCYVFDPLTDFLHIPGSPPAVVKECYQQAFAELPRHRFVYLDLLWEPSATGEWELVSVAGLRWRLCTLELQFKRQLRHERLLIEAAQARQLEVMARLRESQTLADGISLPSTPAEARRVLGLSTEMLERSLRAESRAIEFTKYDPVIVFEEPALLAKSGGHMPLGLVAHWD
jgi:hypothetical protein